MKKGEKLDKRSLTRFRCPCCGEPRYRGNSIKIGKLSHLQGMVIKVCLRGICEKNAKKGLLKHESHV